MQYFSLALDPISRAKFPKRMGPSKLMEVAFRSRLVYSASWGGKADLIPQPEGEWKFSLRH